MANNPPYLGSQPPSPPNVVSIDFPQVFAPSMSFQQFHPAIPAKQLQQFVPVASQNFQSVARGGTILNSGLPSQAQKSQFMSSKHQLPARPGQQVHVQPFPQAPPPHIAQLTWPIASGTALSQPDVQTPNSYMPGLRDSGTPLSSSYSYPASYSGQMPMAQHQHRAQINGSSVHAGGLLGSSVSYSIASATPMQPECEQISVATVSDPIANIQPKTSEGVSADWIEHTSADGRRYYFNKGTRQSTWEKPLQLMTPIERADATTNWKEYTSPDGRKYYYNKVTKLSKWSMPDELKIAREQVEKSSSIGPQTKASTNSAVVIEKASSSDAQSTAAHAVPSSPIPVAPLFSAAFVQAVPVSEPAVSPPRSFSLIDNVDGAQMAVDSSEQPSAAGEESAEASATVISTIVAPTADTISISAQDGSSVEDPAQASEKLDRVSFPEESKKVVAGSEKVRNPLEDRPINQEPATYANRLEAKDAFKALLESVNVGSDWTWEQALRIIINDRRYGALKTLGVRKQAFNEFMVQKKKEEAEERHNQQKKAWEEFEKMLEECVELTSSMRWSKVLTMFEDDKRFKAVERERERRDIFQNYIDALKEKERVRAQEERKRNIIGYRKFLESCDFIKPTTQWRKVQDRLEADETCLCLEKIDRLEIFQEYLRDLESGEEEQKKLQQEELRKVNRKNRDEFRKLMDDHINQGILTAKTFWRDYCMKVRDLPAYIAVASNISGASPKELFEDVVEDLEKQFREDKSRVKGALKLRKITLSSTLALEELKVAIADDVSSPPISDVNLKLVFDYMLERAREKEVKKTKRRKRLTDNLLFILRSFKEVTASSTWEDCKHLIEGNEDCSSIGDENFRKGTFEKYVFQLKVQAKENESKRTEEKQAKEKDREERERRKSRYGREKERWRERDREDCHKKAMVDYNDDKRYRKQHQDAVDSLIENETDYMKDSHKHMSDHKKSRRHGSTAESDSESREKRHKRDHQNASYRDGDREELEEGEFGA